MFKPGDLITGKDRGYVRSIYKHKASGRDDTSIMEFVSLDGVNMNEIIAKNPGMEPETSQRPVDEFRLATPDEVERSSHLGRWNG